MINPTQWSRTVGAAVVVVALMAGLIGCERQEGPAERAGKEVDKTVKKVGQQIDKAGENIKDAADNTKK